MPAKWQQWMPLNIDRFRGSPAVRAMHPTARCGYLYLLMYAWQTEDCTVPEDALTLAEISEIGDMEWATHGPRILRKFESIGGGRLRNSVLFSEWNEARRVFEARSKAANRTNVNRWATELPSVTDAVGDTVSERGPNRSADTRTGTVTKTETNTPEKQKPLRRNKSAADERASPFKEDFGRAFEYANNAPAPWSAKEATNLRNWLVANPTITREQWQKILNNRQRSPINKALSLSVWIGKALSWLNAPADEWGKPISGGHQNGKGTYEKPTTAERQAAELQRSVRDFGTPPRADQDGNGALGDGDGPGDSVPDTGGMGSDSW